ncbi:MAG: amidohydrolase family protein [Myxococcota bacterium]
MRICTLVLSLSLLAACNGDDPPTDGTDTTDGTDDTDAPVLPDNIVQCGEVGPAPTEGVCDVTEGSGSAIAIRGTVLGAEDAYRDGWVVMDGDRITQVGCDADVPSDATVIECGEGVVSPGLIDPHDHLTFTDRAPLRIGERRYDHRHGWRGGVSTPGNRWSGSANGFASEEWGEIRRIFGGGTTLVGSGYARDLIRNLDRDGNQLSDSLPLVDSETFPLGDSNEQYRNNCGWSYKIDGFDSARDNDAILPHVAEGIDSYAADEFYCLSTDFGGGEDITEPNAAHIHGIALSTLDYDRMARDGTSLIWSPRSNLQLYGETARVSTFKQLGGNIALGSDWTYTGSIHIGRELACADAFNTDHLDGLFTDRELWRMTTENAARALQADADLGTIEVGKLADIAVFSPSSDVDSPWRATIEALGGDVALVVLGGEALYGEADVLAGLGESCEAVDVCGNAHAICVERETGRSFGDLSAVVEGAYPAFFCDGPPTDEPLCQPKRPGDWPGEAVDGDADGDGVNDDVDVCPNVFDPIRPIDGGAQLDLDEDGMGDACDDDPLPADLDGDGEPNDTDNCVYEANGDQADADSDGKGDVCDACPSTANPDTPCEVVEGAQLPISTLRTEQNTLLGQAVEVQGAVVTAVWTNGFTMQDPTGTGPNRGISVFARGELLPKVGDVVSVSGLLDDYFDELQVAAEVVNVTGGPQILEPLVVSTADAASEPYEGMLVKVDDTVSNDAYDCSVDGDGCSDPNLWELGGSAGVVVFDRMYTDADWAGNVGKTPVAGVMTTRWERRRIMPRNDADFGQ